MLKYPRTPHLEGSRFQSGDHDLEAVPFQELRSRYVVVEEKLDGANVGISFSESGKLLLQSRGHYLTGGPRERHFALLKQWAGVHQAALWSILSDQYVLYGEWLFAKHTCFYDALPHYFLEFDLVDREEGYFLSTAARRVLLEGLPVRSVPVLWEGCPERLSDLTRWIGPSLYKTAGWRASLAASARAAGVAPEQALRESDDADLMEGLYLKVEEGDRLLGRYKYVRSGFLNALLDSGTHWQDRPIVENLLATGVDLWSF
ncbi:MAG: DNA ligase [Armatimonadetes bacterium]|nr:DNA ligase [Armatimonadota bacterium]